MLGLSVPATAAEPAAPSRSPVPSVSHAATEASAAKAPCPRCNVLLVTFDALRADRLGAYGHSKPTSPAIDELAARSTVFLRNLSQSGSTISSVPSLHTGKFPHTDRLLDDGKLRDSEDTLAEILSRAGYRTMAVIAHRYASCEWGGCQGFEKVDSDYEAPEAAETTLERAHKMLASNDREPFFLWIHFRVPHTPYAPGRDAFLAFYDGPDDAPKYYEGESPNAPIPFQTQRLLRAYRERGEPVTNFRALGGRLDLTPSIVSQLGALYDGNVRAGDTAFGKLLKSLPAEQADRTLVVIASDHGESLGAHERVGHNTLYQDVVHTPLIVHVPGRKGARVEVPTMNVDVLPTVLAAVGQPVPAGLRGVDLLGSLPPRTRPILAEYSNGQVIVIDGWALHSGRQPHLFDLRTDPGETKNVAKERPDRVRDLEVELEAIRESVDEKAAEREDTPVLEKLRALGYISDDQPVE